MSEHDLPPTRKVPPTYTQAADAPDAFPPDAEELLDRLIAGKHDSEDGGAGKDAELEQILQSLSSGNPISPQALEVVAEVVSFLYRCDKEVGE